MTFTSRARLRLLVPSTAFALLSIGVAYASHEPAEGVLIPYVGHLEQDGVPLEGTASLKFSLYDAPTGGSLLHEETDAVLFAGGRFSHVIGDQGGLDSDDIAGNDLWLAITVDSTPLATRQRVTPAPRAVEARRAHNLTLTTDRSVSTGWNDALHLDSPNNAAITHGNLLFGLHDGNDAFYWRDIDAAGYAMTLTAGLPAQLTVDGDVNADSLSGAWDQTPGTNCVRLGGLQIAWGTFGAISHAGVSGGSFYGFGSPVTFPCAFSAAPGVSITPAYNNDGVFAIVPGLNTLTTTGFTPLAWASGTGTTGANNRYVAIGPWQ